MQTVLLFKATFHFHSGIFGLGTTSTSFNISDELTAVPKVPAEDCEEVEMLFFQMQKIMYWSHVH